MILSAKNQSLFPLESWTSGEKKEKYFFNMFFFLTKCSCYKLCRWIFSISTYRNIESLFQREKGNKWGIGRNVFLMLLKKVYRFYYKEILKFLWNVCFLGWQEDQWKEFYILDNNNKYIKNSRIYNIISNIY